MTDDTQENGKATNVVLFDRAPSSALQTGGDQVEVADESCAVHWRPPSYLNERAASAFEKIRDLVAEANTVQDTDYMLVALLASEWDSWVTLTECLEEEGTVYWAQMGRGGGKMLRTNPAEQLRQKSVALMLKMLQQLGMTPAGRRIVKALDGKGDLFGFLEGGQ